MEEKFGIEKLKSASGIITEAINKADAQLADGFQTADLIPIAFAVLPLPEVLKAKDEIVNEWKDLSDDEVIELAANFNVGLNLRNKQVQNKIQKTVSAVAANVVAIRVWTSKPPETPAAPEIPTA